MNVAQTRRFASTFGTLAWFTALAGQAWRNLLGWWGYGVIVVVILALAVLVLRTERPAWNWGHAPKLPLAFLALTVVSISWSAYPAESALAATTTGATLFIAMSLALSLDWRQLIVTLARAVWSILALSFGFELVVAVFVRQRVLPLVPDFDPTQPNLPAAFSWSRGLLFHGGPIDGVVANRNLLAMLALIGVIVFACLLAAHEGARGFALSGLVMAVLGLLLTRSATVLLTAALVAVALGFALWARQFGNHRRRLYITAGALLVASVTFAAVGWRWVVGLLGRGDDLTGRTDIWNKVIELAGERTVAGWGWISYWVPWVKPYAGLAQRNGVTYLQAHNAWLDLWLQVGLIGLTVFVLLAVTSLWATWFLAVDPPLTAAGTSAPYTALSLVPFLLLVALIGQSFGESRLLSEGGLLLLLVIAWATKRHRWEPDAIAGRLRPADARLSSRR
ncbi:MAG TPA: O-antigen ligase family protein [Candidatus Lumbricidophila sp.]|nr:O-antigen ligase family protein [Candidatus Lumbricidophila sp.]